ncbi:MAG: TIGR04282 family arsenosugar biosynthesis glycosyltransferase [Parvicellaceae bacterium]
MAVNNHLIIFTRNPQLGKIKTRLAKSVGDNNALKVYLHLLEHTAFISSNLSVDKHIYYDSYIENNDIFPDQYHKNVQQGEDLGIRMYNAFKDVFGQWAEKVVIIGSDCFELTSDIIDAAFDKLNSHEAVIGPAKDGGYYLFGMNLLKKEYFINKKWGTENVLLDTLLDFKSLGVDYFLLPALNDVDYKEDLGDLEKLLE